MKKRMPFEILTRLKCEKSMKQGITVSVIVFRQFTV